MEEVRFSATILTEDHCVTPKAALYLVEISEVLDVYSKEMHRQSFAD